MNTLKQAARGAFFLLCLACCPVSAALSFTTAPSMTPQGNGTYQVDFAVSETTDVEVSIVDPQDSSVVRYLAAGRLGANAPSPLVKSSLHQVLSWDGKDDLGRTAASPGSLSVRVRAGMRTVFEQAVDRDLRGRSPAYTLSLPVLGLSLDSAGTLYVLGIGGRTSPSGGGNITLRAYDGITGAYQKTLIPFAANMALASVAPYGIVSLSSGKYQRNILHTPYPVYDVGALISIMQDVYSPEFYTVMFPSNNSTRMMIVNYPNRYSTTAKFAEISQNGEYMTAGSLSFIQNPGLPGYAALGGPMYFCPLSDNRNVLMSGFYALRATDSFPADTGFWQDGRIYKVDRLTGTASLWTSMSDSLPKTVALRRTTIGPVYGFIGMMGAYSGMDVDGSGNVFVCDRFHGRVSIFDSTGKYLQGIPVSKPERVAVNRATGEVFVSTHEFMDLHTTSVRLYKFSDWRQGASSSISLAITASTTIREQVMAQDIMSSRAHMVLNLRGAKPLVWWASGDRNVIGIRDDGTVLTVVKDFADSADYERMNFDRIAVDRKKETVYLQNGWSEVYKIENWRNPIITPCSTATGRLLAGDVAIGFDNNLWARISSGGTSGGSWSGPISRFSTAHRHAPLNFGGSGGNSIVSSINSRYGAGLADRGFDASVDGRVIYMDEGNGFTVHLLDTNGNVLNGSLVSPLPSPSSGGVHFDAQGNVYVGALMKPSNHVTTPGYESNTAYSVAVGSVIKYSSSTGGSVSGSSAPGALKVYSKAGFGLFSGAHPLSSMTSCHCRSPRFDVDPYGRVFIPNAVTGQVAVLDNEDNLVARFGEYGNCDSWGPGSPAPTADVPLSCPVGAAASEDFIYVTDMVNERLVCVRMDYALDNIPGITSHGHSVEQAALRHGGASFIAASPNPFNAVVRISLPLAGVRISEVKIYGISGRLAADLTSLARQSRGQCSWNAAGRPSGLYIIKAVQDNRRFEKRIFLAK